MTEVIIGIDLGTTNSEVALLRGDRPEVLGEKQILPSFVGLDEAGNIIVGDAARNQYAAFPERTVKSIKRCMGEAVTVKLGERGYTPPEISAMIVKKLKQIAEQALGEPVHKAVITVPAYFSDAQRQATRDAGSMAGLEVCRIINEPTAAALSYEAEHHGSKTILVYDLGGGTFDVSVVTIQGGVVEVIATHGNNHLGGDDFDQKIAEFLCAHMTKEYKVDVSKDSKAMARILRAAEQAKIKLSDEPFCLIQEEYLLKHKGKPCHLSLELTRTDYEEMIEAYVSETLGLVHHALRDAGLKAGDIDEILTVGGATRTPMISRRLEEEFALQPRGEVNPDLCVALGAAVQAGIVAGKSAHSVLVDITPYSFGTSVLDEDDYTHNYVPLIRKNTPIPVTKTEAFYTCVDGQKQVNVKVYQGEDPDPDANIMIGNFTVEGLRKVEAGNMVTLTFGLDLDGILNVTAIEKETGLKKAIQIQKALSKFEEGEIATARKRIDHLFGMTPSSEVASEDPVFAEARVLIAKGESAMESASAEDREELVDLIEEIKDAIENDAADKLAVAMESLNEIIFYLEEA